MSNQSNTPNGKPQTVQDIIHEIEHKSKGGGYIYRGERKDNPNVSSKLYREFNIEGEHFDIERVQTEMLVAAKKHIGHLPQDFRVDVITSPKAGGETTEEAIDLEILSDIQHYGGKTNLIDFTTDYFIALFFACDGRYTEDGRVIVKKTDEMRDMIEPPRNPRHRVIVQKSVFIRPPQGFIEPHEEEIVVIPAALKQDILEHLRNYHGISTEVIYNDLHGFIKNQDIHGDAYTHFYRGFACQDRADKATSSEVKREEYEKAIEHYTNAINVKPDFAEAYNNRGVAYRSIGDFEAAIEDYTKAIDLDPEYANAYNNRGNAYLNIGNFETAIQDYTKAIDLKPEDASAYNSRGLAYAVKSDFDAAIKDYNKAIDLKPEDADVYCNRGLAYAVKSDFDAAIKDYNKAIDLDPEDARFYNNRGVAYRNIGDFEAAIQDFSKAINLDPEDAGVYSNRGKAWLHLKEWQKAKSDLTTAKDMGFDIIKSFQNDYASVADFEAKNGVNIPTDIAALLQRN